MKKHITMAEAARLLPSRPSVSNLYRWAEKGVDGVTLETIRVGHRRYTTPEAVHRFQRRVNQSVAELLEEEGC